MEQRQMMRMMMIDVEKTKYTNFTVLSNIIVNNGKKYSHTTEYDATYLSVLITMNSYR